MLTYHKQSEKENSFIRQDDLKYFNFYPLPNLQNKEM